MSTPESGKEEKEHLVADDPDKLALDDEFDSETIKYVAIGGVATILGAISVVAAKRLYDKRKER